jgi:predicted nucleic-acid-binding Zn-ribbon protein
MKNGKCPKCGSATVHSKTNGIAFGNSNGRVDVISSMLTRPSPAIAFVCITCGYFENYIADPGKLAEVAKTWQKVPAEAQ